MGFKGTHSRPGKVWLFRMQFESVAFRHQCILYFQLMNGRTVKNAVLKVSGTIMFERPILGGRFDSAIFCVRQSIIKLA